MNISSFTISLTVDSVEASSEFLKKHFGFAEKMAADGFASLIHEQSKASVVFLRRGIEILPEDFRDRHADGVILAFVTENLEAEEKRLIAEGIEIYLPLKTEDWGEKLFQVKDPNGIIIELVEWV